jgi:indole-3-glycerol phosphate synthase
MEDTMRAIYSAKARRLSSEEAREPYAELRERALARVSERRSFLGVFRGGARNVIIAEIKKSSPSAGTIASDFDPVAIARAYEAGGAGALSILTEETRFDGDLSYLDLVRRASHVPLLRKDFLWTRYQMAQSAAYGADCVLLIVAGMDDAALRECLDEARAYALDALVEVHNEDELRRALQLGAAIIGMNNRNLRTLVTDLTIGERLLAKIPSDVVAVSESGMRDRSDVARMSKAGARGFLIGEALMRAHDPAELLRSLRTA